jgi:hypothetical protein
MRYSISEQTIVFNAFGHEVAAMNSGIDGTNETVARLTAFHTAKGRWP